MTIESVRINALRPDILHLIIMPTERCNFRCTYCYEDFKIGRMPPSIVSGIKKLLRKRIGELTSLHIGWFGGEPTLATDIVRDINNAVLEVKTDQLQFSSSMSTNGWLLNEQVFRSLVTAGVTTYQISIDGLGEWHDKTRVTAGGAGTFDRIVQNVKNAMALQEEFRIALRLHVSEENSASMEPLIDYLADLFAEDGRIKIYVKEIEPLGSANDRHFRFLRRPGFMDQLRRRVREAGMWESGGQPVACYAALPTSLVIRADGRIAKCTVALKDDRNTLGSINQDGEIKIDSDKLKPWIVGVLTGDEAALHCPLSVMDHQLAH
jgi:uncharacterized protein